ITARPSSLVYRTGKLLRRRKALFAGSAIAAVALAVTVVTTISARRTERQSLHAPVKFALISGFPGSHRAPTLSPPGDRVAYVDFGRAGVPQVWIQELAGGEPRQLTFGERAASRPRWSPRDDSIVFELDRAGIWSVPIAGGEPRQLLADG